MLVLFMYLSELNIDLKMNNLKMRRKGHVIAGRFLGAVFGKYKLAKLVIAPSPCQS
jgi:hypothetical protein